MKKKQQKYEETSLDVDLLRRLPTKGTGLGDSLLAPSAKYLRESVSKTLPPGSGPTSSEIRSRLRMLKNAGLVVSVTVNGTSRAGNHGNALGWQRTAEADAALELHDKERE